MPFIPWMLLYSDAPSFSMLPPCSTLMPRMNLARDLIDVWYICHHNWLQCRYKQLMADIISDPISKNRVMVDIMNEPDVLGMR